MTREECIKRLRVYAQYSYGIWQNGEEDTKAFDMAIEALQNAEINCVHCPHYHETEDDTGVHSHCGSHGRLIDADALLEAVDRIELTCDGGVDINDLERIIREASR